MVPVAVCSKKTLSAGLQNAIRSMQLCDLHLYCFIKLVFWNQNGERRNKLGREVGLCVSAAFKDADGQTRTFQVPIAGRA